MWTALVRELIQKKRCKKVVPVNLVAGNAYRVVHSEIFDDNPKISYDLDCLNSIKMVLNDQSSNYCLKDDAIRAHHRYECHAVEQIYTNYKIISEDLKGELFFSTRDKTIAHTLMIENFLKANKFIVIEPCAKNEYSVNKEYPFFKWQLIVDRLIQERPDITIAQVGVHSTKKLNGVVDLVGRTSFKQAAYIIKKSSLLVCTEGGLMHAANTYNVNTRSVVVTTGYMHPNMTCYKDNENIWTNNGHGPCGLKIKCDQCHKEVMEHDTSEIYDAIVKNV